MHGKRAGNILSNNGSIQIKEPQTITVMEDGLTLIVYIWVGLL